MSIKINKINDRHYTINGKVAQQDMNENWICVEELSPSESKAFKSHLEQTKEVVKDDLIGKKVIYTFDPLGGVSRAGQYIIKISDGALTPIASVTIGVGIDPVKANDRAKKKAERIVRCLNYCRNMSF